MTHRELEVLAHIVGGKSNREVADLLCLSKRTIDFHVSNVYEKLQVKNRTQAYLAAERLGLFPQETLPGNEAHS